MSELPGEYWQLNLSLLEAQPMLITAEALLASFYCKFLNELRIRTAFLAASENGPLHSLLPLSHRAFT